LFFFNKESVVIFVLIYVDDIIVASSTHNGTQVHCNRTSGASRWLPTAAPPHRPPPSRTARTRQDLLDRASLTDHRTAETPMELNIHLTATDGDPLENPTRYHHIIGSLIYLGVTRPDIAYSVHIMS
jgi:hypothetical protein